MLKDRKLVEILFLCISQSGNNQKKFPEMSGKQK